jgi:hypothetical protein
MAGCRLILGASLKGVEAAYRPPFIVMVRLDRTISRNKPVRTSLGKPLVRSSRTMTQERGHMPFDTHLGGQAR